jgi:uncharacterized protein
LITDPWFYVFAVPAVLLLGLSKSGFAAGFGSLAVPIMALSVPVPQAAAIFLPLLLAMDILGQHALWQHIDRQFIKFLIPFGLLGTVVGTVTFKYVDSNTVAGIVGIFTWLFLAQRLLFSPKPGDAATPKWVGALLTITSGFTSFVSHAGGPPVNAYVIPMRMAPLVFTATMGSYFMALNLSKWVPYVYLGLFDAKNLWTSLVLLPLAPVGVYSGIALAKRISAKAFYNFIYLGMFLTGGKLIWDGFLKG